QTVAITAGSRGLVNYATIVRTMVDELKALGARPFIVPAMGSHGGATTEGQRELLARYGITEQNVGAPVKSSMEVVEIGRSSQGIPVFLDKHASQADHIAVLNRVKPHTLFTGEVESGLTKMLLIGLGKREGAALYHRAIVQYSWGEIVRAVANVVLSRAPIAFGLALIENAYHQTARIVGVAPQDFLTVEPHLLRQARAMMAKLPFNRAELLIVDEMGKEISGVGIDPNVTGRRLNPDVHITRIFIRDLTEATHGNANGVGLTDVTTKALVAQVDWKQTYMNAFTAGRTDSCKLPIVCDTEREAVEFALQTIGLVQPEAARVMWIKNTQELDTLKVSESYAEEVKGRADLELLMPPAEMRFGVEGRLLA
ncbi:MAG: DUF2088 domain-containing protein, partial [Planctomycetes bacterium]|nr:DUF2088 domain-containing protein [Planctomycetota bacterium]